MTRTPSVRLIGLLLSSCVALATGVTLARTLVPVLHLDGFGPLRIGMTPAQVRATGTTIRTNEGEDRHACWEGALDGHPGVFAMFVDGRLVRLSLTQPSIATRSGLQVGMSEAQAQAIYGGRLAVEPHKYALDGKYLKLFSKDRRRALVIETKGTKVTEVHAGEAEAAQYVEDCL